MVSLNTGIRRHAGTSEDLSPRSKRLIRRVSFFRKAGLFSDHEVSFEITRATELDELWQAYRLVHDCYLERGYIKEYPGRARIRPFEAVSEMATFVAKVGERVVAVSSVLMDSDELGLPSDHVFAQEIGDLRAAGRRVCEITNLAVDAAYRNTPVFSELTRCCLAHAMAVNYDDMFIAISPEHSHFFEDVLLFQPCGGRRSYSTEVEDYVVGKRLDLETIEDQAVDMDITLAHEAFLHDFYFTTNPYQDDVRRWAIRAARIFADIELLRELFIDRSRLIDRHRENAGVIRAIRTRWGDDTYARVTGEPVDTSFAGDELMAAAS